MRFLAALLFIFLIVSCSHGDKEREDFPNTHQKGEKEYERHMERAQDSTMKADSAFSRP